MPITEADIRKIAELAHLEITDEELRTLAPQVASIVAYVEQLNELDTSRVEPSVGGLTPEGARAAAARALSAAENLNDTLNAFLQIDRAGATRRAEEIDAALSEVRSSRAEMDELGWELIHDITTRDSLARQPLAGIPIAVKDN